MEGDLTNTLDAFNYIYKKHFTKLAIKFGSEDLVNNAFCVWLEKFHNNSLVDTDKPGAVYNFVKKVIKNTKATSRLRIDPFIKSNTIKKFESINDETPEYLLLKKEQTSIIKNIVDDMPMVRKQQMNLFLQTGSIEETSKLANTKYNTVKTNLHFAKQTIKDKFEGFPIDVVSNVRLLAATSLGDDTSVYVVNRAFMPADSKSKMYFTKRQKTNKKTKIKPDYNVYDSDIIKLRTNGATYVDISSKLKIPFRYVKSLCVKHNLLDTKINRTKDRKEAAVILELHNKGLSVTEIEQQTGYKRYLIYECIPRIY